MTTLPALAALTATSIDVNAHQRVTLAGITLHVDTILATLVAGAIVVGFGLYAGRRAQVGKPGKAQLLWETVVSAVERRVEQGIGPTGRRVVPLAVSLFAFILIANWLELVPSGSPKALPAPTGDLNLTFALAGFVIVLVHASAIWTKGLRGYLRHYVRPSPWLLPINIVEELAKPVTLALRLFGNVFAGAVMAVLILELLPAVVAPLPLLLWKLFSMLVAVVQAFIFALLTILYFEQALRPDETQPGSPGGDRSPLVAPLARPHPTLEPDRPVPAEAGASQPER
ncbi:MAG: F0F1 ATP synthase subunit A [Acidimicrobiales bacterium]